LAEYKIERTEFGVRLSIGPHPLLEEILQWAEDVKEKVHQVEGPFCVLADLRQVELIPPESQPILTEVQAYCRSRGMMRSACLLNNKLTALQFRRIAKSSGIYAWERYIDCNQHENAEKIALGWLLDEVDPDLDPKTMLQEDPA